jgi:hypothetical protein
MVRYFLSILIGIGVIVLVIVLIVKALSGGKHTPNKQIDLASYASKNSVVHLLIDAPVVGNDQHRAIEISVDNSAITLDILQGYEGKVTTHKAYDNTQAAYEVFLKALQYNGFTKGDINSTNSDERGVCALGDRYVYMLASDDKTVFRMWSTSCGGQGTFGGSPQTIRTLFRRQIPDRDFSQLTNNIPLN